MKHTYIRAENIEKIIYIYGLSWIVLLTLALMSGDFRTLSGLWVLTLLIYYGFAVRKVKYSLAKKVIIGFIYWISTGVTAMLSSLLGAPGLVTSFLALYVLVWSYKINSRGLDEKF